jgi:hypothetical protein
MIGYRKRSFTRAHGLLAALRANQDDLVSLLAVQQLLFSEIVRTEKKIRALKAELKGIQQTGGHISLKRSHYLKTRIEKVRQVTYVWRCFGDALAFLYMDRFALKQSFYSTEKPTPKQEAGFMTDKLGLPNEIALLEECLEHGIPALLADLTNSIRHGDVCLMSGPDPLMIEVKSSKDLNRRGKRQKRALEKLRSFFETDKATELRGFANVRRASFEGIERAYVKELNACIADARKNGSAVLKPESGLTYIVAVAGHKGRVVDSLHATRPTAPWVFILNEFKNNREWAPYVPFTLSLEAHDDLWDFISGDLYIIVIMETGALLKVASDYGCKATLDPLNVDYPYSVKIPGIDEPFRISSPMLARIGIEFVSPEGLLRASIDTMKHVLDTIKQDT